MEESLVLFRMVERLLLSGLIVLVSLAVMIAFWRSLQRIEFQVTRDKIGAGGTLVLATPVFVLLAMIGYAWVSLTNPITVATTGAAAAGEGAPGPVAAADRPLFIGVAPGRAADGAEDAAFERNLALGRVKSLNCYAAAAADPSPRMTDDLAVAKLAMMRPVWTDEWGAFDAFAAWATGRSQDAPNAAARSAFEAVHPLC